MIGLVTLMDSCGSKREPGRTYMPDMAYSRAYEAYASNNLATENINYIPYPVGGLSEEATFFLILWPTILTGIR